MDFRTQFDLEDEKHFESLEYETMDVFPFDDESIVSPVVV